MKLNHLVLRNFMAFEHAEIDFTKYTGVTLIEGRTRGSGSASNGSGKTALLIEPITWLLFGNTVRDLECVDDVRFRWNDEKVEVFGELERDDGSKITIERSRTKSGVNNLRVSGLASEGLGVQPALERMLGLDYKLFTRSVMFGGEVSAFCRLRDSERKAILEELLGLAYFEKARGIAKEQADTVAAEIQVTVSKIEALNAGITRTQELLQETKKNQDEYETRYEREMENLNTLIEETSETTSIHVEKIFELREQSFKEDIIHQQKLDEHNDLLNTKKIELEQAKNARIEAHKVLVECGINKRRFDEEILKFSKEKHPDICPTCGQVWNQKDAKHLAAHITGLQKAADEWSTKEVKARHAYTVASAKETSLDDERDAIANNPPSRGDSVVALDVAIEALDRESETIERLFWKKKELRNARSNNTHKDTIARLTTSIDTEKKEIEVLEQGIADKRTELDTYEYWKKGFSRQGIPSLLIENAFPKLNEAVRTYSKILTDGDLRVSFLRTDDSSSRLPFEIRVQHTNGGGTYKSQSAGEKTRVDLCVLLAIRELMSTRMIEGFHQLFIDEVFDGLDAVGVEKVMELLRKCFTKQDVFLITHDEGLKGLADNVISVNKIGKVSSIIEKRKAG